MSKVKLMNAEKIKKTIKLVNTGIVLFSLILFLVNKCLQSLFCEELVILFTTKGSLIVSSSLIISFLLEVINLMTDTFESIILTISLVNFSLPFFYFCGLLRTVFKLDFNILIFIILLEISLRLYMLFRAPFLHKEITISSCLSIFFVSLISLSIHSKFNYSILSFNAVSLFMHVIIMIQSNLLKKGISDEKMKHEAITSKNRQLFSLLKALDIGFGYLTETGKVFNNSTFTRLTGHSLSFDFFRTLLNQLVASPYLKEDLVKLIKYKKECSLEKMIHSFCLLKETLENFTYLGDIESKSYKFGIHLRLTKEKHFPATLELIVKLYNQQETSKTLPTTTYSENRIEQLVTPFRKVLYSSEVEINALFSGQSDKKQSVINSIITNTHGLLSAYVKRTSSISVKSICDYSQLLASRLFGCALSFDRVVSAIVKCDMTVIRIVLLNLFSLLPKNESKEISLKITEENHFIEEVKFEFVFKCRAPWRFSAAMQTNFNQEILKNYNSIMIIDYFDDSLKVSFTLEYSSDSRDSSDTSVINFIEENLLENEIKGPINNYVRRDSIENLCYILKSWPDWKFELE